MSHSSQRRRPLGRTQRRISSMSWSGCPVRNRTSTSMRWMSPAPP